MSNSDEYKHLISALKKAQYYGKLVAPHDVDGETDNPSIAIRSHEGLWCASAIWLTLSGTLVQSEEAGESSPIRAVEVLIECLKNRDTR